MKSLMDNLDKTGNEIFGLELSKHKSDELCLAVFSNTAVRDDGLPLLYLHTLECWNISGHVCLDLPPNGSENLEEE